MSDRKRLSRRRTVRLPEDVDDIIRIKESKGEFNFNRFIRKNLDDVLKKEMKKGGKFRVG